MSFVMGVLHLQQQVLRESGDRGVVSIRLTRRAGEAAWSEISRGYAVGAWVTKSADGWDPPGKEGWFPPQLQIPKWFEIYGIRVEVE